MSQSSQSMSEFLDDLWSELREPVAAASTQSRAAVIPQIQSGKCDQATDPLLPACPVDSGDASASLLDERVVKLLSPFDQSVCATNSPGADPATKLTTAARTLSERPVVAPFPEVPRSLRTIGISSDWLSRLILKLLAARGALQGRQIASHIRLLFPLVEALLSDLRREQLVVLKGEAVAGDYTYVITERGLTLARGFSRECTYFGATPVTIDQYNAMMKLQSVIDVRVRAADLERAFKDLLVDPALLRILGPAINSGRGLFLFGEPGNGKTSIAERVSRAFGEPIWIPRALLADGNVIRVFDPAIHEPVPLESPEFPKIDPAAADQRWICVRRPTVIAGGELTMSELEVSEDAGSHISEAPLQLKSNGGVLLIDDFGRQRMPVDELLNRWIVPLEKRYDLLNLPSGKKVRVPFDQLVIFSTNLEPRDLVDDAFLRRIPYKVEVPNPTPEQFHELFQIMCRHLDVEYRRDAVDYLIHTHYQRTSRVLRACHPRDLLLQIRNFCQYEDVPLELTRDSIDFAVRCYFSVLG
ncbi:AAA family ATPase [bacterium]|nr:AAA family ATPase [bacterium]